MDSKKPVTFGIAWLGLRKSWTHERILELEEQLKKQTKHHEADQKRRKRRSEELGRQVDYLKEDIEGKERYIEQLITQKLNIMDRKGFEPSFDERVKQKLRLGDLMVVEGLITQWQLNEAMDRQKTFGGRLGDLVVEMGFTDKARVAALINQQAQKGRLGDMLVDTGAITQLQLNEALDNQRKSGGMLGDILMSLRSIDPEKLYRQIATQNNLGRIGTDFAFEDIINKLPETLAREYDAVVINKDLNRFLVAVGQPLSNETAASIEERLGMPIEQVLATRDEMEYFWKEVYQSELMVESTQKLVNEQPQNSAHITFTTSQLVTTGIFVGLFVLCMIIDWFHTLIILNVMVQIFYFSMTIFKFLIVMFGTRENAQMRFTKEEIDAIDERSLPIYTILVPMYKESEVIPHLLGNIEQIDYPKSKLDVRLLIEQDDIEAQELLKEMNLPPYYTTIVVPHSLPKTKPKACNYGLIRARGEYVVIFDAEDRPDSDQLKKVHAAFVKNADNCACIQAKLNYFNSEQNMLTRWFTHEYSMWFELLLPGVMQLDIPIPLGGTSNHFKMKILKEINAWDPYNVTEDADLGIRLYKSGYSTAIVDSRTWEEANSRVGNWIRQRSRWIKGYMQTWLVHMRNPFRLYRELGLKGFMGFQVMVLATPMLPLLNPFYWVMIILWYGWKVQWIPQFFPGPIYYLAAMEFLIGNFLFVFSNVAGIYWVIHDLEKRKENIFSYGLVKHALLTPIYWVLMSLAAVKAAWQLITKPFYWEKTTHGLSKNAPNTFSNSATQDGG
ncbi:glycosyltransferase family 2 protein [Paenibacillus agricola]|uniref:Glycosyltransferase n=1 Tax=Paenibacillus agricola TaxID=2716264 RepID=A0ABX0JCH1_9BACL|nr:glycosyltransferase family 2 protein [Paenibacillus agricola]NHN32941.1 glycosyltransferase [Paenibacillus agricola]